MSKSFALLSETFFMLSYALASAFAVNCVAACRLGLPLSLVIYEAASGSVDAIIGNIDSSNQYSYNVRHKS
jgi:hypothetical protein